MKLKMSVAFLALSGCGPCAPTIARWEGEAEFARAEQNRKIKVLEAQAIHDAAKLMADAEIERARGVAESNKIVGESLKNNEVYLKWLWIKGLEESGNHAPTTIYIPTEAGLPILEAGRLTDKK